ncbi:hypothetical protein [Absidia glauca]|uniref:C2H2-type domain-containing protein n=1 Tax=Absidia glauca TaxID=4829 RepID=A0A163K2F0_ABSGL|nr:hypothetical protein [Absidia glauca]
MSHTTLLNGPLSMFLDQQASPPLANNEDSSPPSTILPDPSVDLFGASACKGTAPFVEELLSMKDVTLATFMYESIMQRSLCMDPLASTTADRHRHDSISSSSSSSSMDNKVFSFVRLPGKDPKKRPRRRFNEIERLYHCNFGKCKKSYGTLNHLNSHIVMQAHGPKRQPSEFKEMRREWRRARKQKDANDQTNRQQEAHLMATAMATTGLHF